MHKGVSGTLFFAMAMFLAPLLADADTEARSDVKAETKGVADKAAPASPASFPIAKPVDRLPHKLIQPGDIYYPVELAKAGVQGEVKLDIELSPEGKLLSAKIVDSSRSDELDKNALSYVNADLGNWTLPATHPKGESAHYLLSLVFNRDSVLSINLKTCAELNADLAYFRATYPEDEPKNVASLELIASLFTVQLIKTRGAEEALKYAKALDAINADTIRICIEKPDDRVIETYVKTAKNYRIRF